MKKKKRNDPSYNWSIGIIIALSLLGFSGAMAATASVRQMTMSQLMVEYFIPCLLGTIVCAVVFAIIFNLIGKGWNSVSKKG